MKRVFDIVLSSLGLILLSPAFAIISIAIKATSTGPVLYSQVRVGRHGKDFLLLKFRTMYLNSDRIGLLTVGNRDPRITSVGYFLRKYKLDEIPQLVNVLIGNMSLVGPRPEVRKYVDIFPEAYNEILAFRPGITDPASIQFSNENELLEGYNDVERAYIDVVLPAKIKLAAEYVNSQSFQSDLKIIFSTVLKIVLGNKS